MGLDQFLSKRIYVGANYEHRKVTGKIDIKVDGKPLKINFNKVSYIEEQAIYWRKSNQIHQFFVDNVQDGVDDCRSYYVPREKLEELLKLCKEVKSKAILSDGKIQNGYAFKDGKETKIFEDGKYIINDTEIAELLPTQAGFFFGSTDYDEYYMDDIDYTIEGLTKLLDENDDNVEFEYHSSW